MARTIGPSSALPGRMPSPPPIPTTAAWQPCEGLAQPPGVAAADGRDADRGQEGGEDACHGRQTLAEGKTRFGKPRAPRRREVDDR
jgi:hypothetical protein